MFHWGESYHWKLLARVCFPFCENTVLLLSQTVSYLSDLSLWVPDWSLTWPRWCSLFVTGREENLFPKKQFILISQQASLNLITVTTSDIMGSSVCMCICVHGWQWYREHVYFPKVGLMFPTRSNYSGSVDSLLSVCIKDDPHLMAWSNQTHRAAFINKQINKCTPTTQTKQQFVKDHRQLVHTCRLHAWSLACLPDMTPWHKCPVSWCCLSSALADSSNSSTLSLTLSSLYFSSPSCSVTQSLACLWPLRGKGLEND